MRMNKAQYCVGIDTVEISRIRKCAARDSFMKRVFSASELEMFRSKRDPAPSIAANWAAKEAFSKALGTGVRGFGLCEVECLRDELGAPYLVLSGKAEQAAEGLSFCVSLTHTKDLAAAIVIGQGR